MGTKCTEVKFKPYVYYLSYINLVFGLILEQVICSKHSGYTPLFIIFEAHFESATVIKISPNEHNVSICRRDHKALLFEWQTDLFLQPLDALPVGALPGLQHALSLKLGRAQTLGLQLSLLAVTGGQVNQPASTSTCGITL